MRWMDHDFGETERRIFNDLMKPPTLDMVKRNGIWEIKKPPRTNKASETDTVKFDYYIFDEVDVVDQKMIDYLVKKVVS